MYCGLHWFSNSCNFHPVCDLHLAILSTAFLRFNFLLTSTRCIFRRFIVFAVIFTVTKRCARCSVCLFFFDNFYFDFDLWALTIFSWYYFGLISAYVSSDNEIWVDLSVHVFFLRIVPDEGIHHLVHLGCSLQKFRHNIRQTTTQFKASNPFHMHKTYIYKFIHLEVPYHRYVYHQIVYPCSMVIVII